MRRARDLFQALLIGGMLALCLLAALISGCASLPAELPVSVNEKVELAHYRHDLRVKVNGVDFVGVGVAPSSLKYEIKVFPETSIDRIIWTTCNRQEVVDKPPKGGFWGSDKTYTFVIDPVDGLEDVRACPIKIDVLTERQTRTGFALIDFQDKRAQYQTIYGTLKCNGKQESRIGALVCQSAEGLIQEISFDRPVASATPDAGCSEMKDLTGEKKIYRFAISADTCLYLFSDRDGNRFRLHTVGYNQVPYRGE